jgi:hypothetical protein
MINDICDARDVNLVNSAMEIKSPQWCLSGIIPSNRMLQINIHGSSPSINYDL